MVSGNDSVASLNNFATRRWPSRFYPARQRFLGSMVFGELEDYRRWGEDTRMSLGHDALSARLPRHGKRHGAGYINVPQVEQRCTTTFPSLLHNEKT
jgi:hypothetical protein